MFTLKNTISLHALLRKPDPRTQTNRLKFRSVAGLTAGLTLAAIAALPVCGRELGSRGGAVKGAQGSADNKTVITVRASAGVYVPGPLFNVHVTSVKPVSSTIPEAIQHAIQEGLSKNDRRLQLSTSNPDTLITCTIVDHSVGSGVANRTRSEYRTIGTKTVHDPSTGMSRIEDEYGYVDVPYRALVLEGRMPVECEVKDVKTGIILYVERFDPVYSEVLREVFAGSSSPSIENLNNVYLRLAENVAGLILARLSPRTYSEIVQLPLSGKVKEASKLLEAEHWKEALDLLAGIPIFKDTTDESHRLYALGIAREGLAYGAVNPAETKSHLEEAVNNYRQATQLKPREDMFWHPKNRAELSLWQAGGLVAQIDAFEEAKKTASSSDQPVVAGKRDLFRQVSSRRQPPPTVVRNETVIQWVKSGLTQDYITASVKHAPKAQFDLSPVEVLKLRREGVSSRIIKAMQDTQPRHPYSGIRTRSFLLLMAIPVVSAVLGIALSR